jgi:hypothetical protein
MNVQFLKGDFRIPYSMMNVTKNQYKMLQNRQKKGQIHELRITNDYLI